MIERITRITMEIFSAVAKDENRTMQLRGCAMFRVLQMVDEMTCVTDGSKLPNSIPFKQSSVLLTYQGPWGDISVENGEDMRADIDIVCLRLSAHPQVSCLWAAFNRFAEQLHDHYKCEGMAVGCELCCKTLVGQGALKVHLHLWLALSIRADRVLTSTAVRWRGTAPHTSGLAGSMSDKRKGFTRYCGCYYIRAPKIGQIFHAGTKVPFEDFTVAPSWISALVMAGKMNASAAKLEYARALCCAESNIRNLECAARIRREHEQEVARLHVERAIRDSERAFRMIPAVEYWKQQYEIVQGRYKFLVLDGPSRMGKTRFTLSMGTPQSVLSLDCAACVEPDMKSFIRGQHTLLLFDEARATMVIRCKKLFQASSDLVQMATSATNMMSYVVWVHAIRMVIASNRWQPDVEALDPQDRSWIEANSVYVFVDHPLFL